MRILFIKKILKKLHTYSLYDLNEYIRRILALNLGEALWVTAEIAQVGLSRGHYYLDLVQKSPDGDELVAQSQAVLWQGQYRQLRRQTGLTIDELLTAGVAVRIKVKVDFHERFGLKLFIEDIDPTYTFGLLHQQRQEVIRKLQAAGLFEKNAALPLPSVIQRVAVLSSATAAGYQDFLTHLRENPYHYAIAATLFEVAVQGAQVEANIVAALNRISLLRRQFDAVVVIRGGGARTDLAAFDQYGLCVAAAHCPLPLLTGIGHETDAAVLDLVAARSLKTPTAAADFIIAHNLQFEQRLLTAGQAIQRQALALLRDAGRRLDIMSQQTKSSARQQLAVHQRLLDYISRTLPALSRSRLQYAALEIDQLERLQQSLNIDNALRRGFTITTRNGKAVKAAELRPGDRLHTRFSDGKADSIVE